jgi:hypothetical protein
VYFVLNRRLAFLIELRNLIISFLKYLCSKNESRGNGQDCHTRQNNGQSQPWRSKCHPDLNKIDQNVGPNGAGDSEHKRAYRENPWFTDQKNEGGCDADNHG